MEPFRTVSGIAAALPAANIDTDVIMPKQFLKGIDRQGLARGAFHGLRFDESGATRPEFILNDPRWAGARFLVTGPNFGCGSSREHAVWGLMQLGVRALIGTSYGGIFFDNCARNGLLVVTLEQASLNRIFAIVSNSSTNKIKVDLETQTISLKDECIAFEIDPVRRQDLILGQDAVGNTLNRASEINAFEARHFEARPWLRPRLSP